MKTYILKFGDGDPRQFGGMRPTFLSFQLSSGVTVTPPGISEIPTSMGIFFFNWTPTTQITFLADAATTSPGSSSRYLIGSLDPVDRADEYLSSLIAIGVSLTASGVSLAASGLTLTGIGITITAIVSTSSGNSDASLIGGSTSLMGDNLTMPTDLFGYMKRIDALLEGQETYVKATNNLIMYDKTGATTLSSQTITNSASAVIKA